LTYILVLSTAFLNGAIGMFYRRWWVTLFTSDPEVIELAYNTLWVMWIYTVMDASKAVGALAFFFGPP